MEGRAIARPNADSAANILRVAIVLQWRAGQLPGQTMPEVVMRLAAGHLQWRAGQLPGQTIRLDAPRPGVLGPSMEGRAIARPNRQQGRGGRAVRRPSMEGRAIARPNVVLDGCDDLLDLGPSMEGRAIARPNPPASAATTSAPSSLQWRAGQLPGQTTSTSAPTSAPNTFNGGPGNCPAKPLA